MRILLIGLPTSGKSHLAKFLSDELALPFVDQDDFMEKMFGQTDNCNELFTENNYIKSGQKLSELENTIIASGGGFGIFENILNLFDMTIFLDISEELFTENIIKARKSPFTKENKRRCLVQQNDNINNLKNTANIKEDFHSRKPLYLLNSDYTFSYSSRKEQETAFNEILKLVKSKINQ